MWNKKWIFILWYMIWVVVAMLFNKKNSKQLKNKFIEKNKTELDIILDNFIEIHKNIFISLNEKINSPETKQFFESKKNEFLELLNEYKEKWYEILKQYKEKWEDYVKEWIEELEKFYKEKIQDLEDNLKDKTSDDILNEIKKELKTMVEDFKKYLKDDNK